jgi:hypothetical protein
MIISFIMIAFGLTSIWKVKIKFVLKVPFIQSVCQVTINFLCSSLVFS